MRIFGGRPIDHRRALLRRVRRRTARRRLAVAARRARRRRARQRRRTQQPVVRLAPPATLAAAEQPQMGVRRQRQPTPRRPRDHRRRTPPRRSSAFTGSQRSKGTARSAGRHSSGMAIETSTLGCIRPQTRPRVRTTPRPDRSDGEPAPPQALPPARNLPPRTCSRLPSLEEFVIHSCAFLWSSQHSAVFFTSSHRSTRCVAQSQTTQPVVFDT